MYQASGFYYFNSLETQALPFLQDVYVSKFGHDSATCGSRHEPCQSVKQAVLRVNGGGRILLNGTGTEQYPYGCDGDSQPGITVNKNLTMVGLYHTPYVSCDDGIQFRNSDDGLQIELLGIVFRQTPLTFEDCLQVKASKCTFQNASTAFNIQIQNRTSCQIDIQSSMFFYNGPFCIKFLLLGKNTNQSLDVALKVFNTKFVENGVLSRQPIDRGVVVITSQDETVSNDTHIHTFFENVTCKRNQGPFIILNVSKAVTDEMYKDVYLKHNAMTSSSKMSHFLHVNSLYHSVTKETHTKFINFQCVQNSMLRCIGIQSEKADVVIQESTFVGHYLTREPGAALRLEIKFNASLKVFNSDFTNNTASEGGALFANSPHGTLNLNFSNSNFTVCSAFKSGRGCAISVGKPPLHGNSSCPFKLNFKIRKLIFSNCHGHHSRCVTVYIRFNNGRVDVKESKWVNNLHKTSGTLHVFSETADSEANVSISRSSFTDNEGNTISLSAINANPGNATIVDNLIANYKNMQKVAVKINSRYKIKLKNITVTNFRYGLISLKREGREAFPVNIAVINCTFMNNIYDMLLTFHDPTSIQLMIRNTIFTSNEIRERSYAIRLHIPPLINVNSSDAVIELENNTFDSRPSSSFALFFQGNKTLSIRRSIFKNCICFYREKWSLSAHKSFYETATGALSILTNPDKLLQLGCVSDRDVKKNIHPMWTYRSHVLIEDTIFHDNAGLVAGGVYISNGYTKFERCAFQDNFGIEQTGHVYSAYGTGQVHFKDCSFSTTKTNVTILKNNTFNKANFLYSESGGPMKFQNTSMRFFVAKRGSYPVFDISSGGYVEVDDNTTIQCSEGNQLLFENTTHFVLAEENKFCKINVTSLKFSCKSCSTGYYSLHRGSMRGLTRNSSFVCLPCPFGATCIHSNIAAKPNFWGRQISEHPQSLHFIACPEDYCQSPASGSKDYNSCQGNRTGILCGACAPGYSESLLSAECLPPDKCGDKWLWILAFLAITGFAIYLLTKPPVLKFLGRQILWCKRKEQHQVTQELGQAEEHFDSGYLKIAFFFYQVAELLTVGSTNELLHKLPIIPAMVAGFNFRIRLFKERMRCPFFGLTVVTKELLLSGTVFATMANVVLIYFMHLCFNIARHKAIPSPQLYIAVIIEILLLGYERLVETSFKLMDCVPIGAEKRLFFDGNVKCWQRWQYALLAYNTVFVVPFIFVLYFGSSKLYKTSLSATEFVCACILPLPFLIFWLMKVVLKNREQQDTTTASAQLVNQHVLEVIIGPFRPPNDVDNGTLYWESILIGRRFTLLACHALIDDAMLCMVVMTFACVLMLLHHVWKNPYHDPIANGAETVSLLVLVMIAFINLIKATLISFGTTPVGPSKSYIQAMDWVQILALIFLPMLLSFCVVLAVLSQLFRFIVLLARHIRCCLQMLCTSLSTTEERRPIIDGR